MFRACFAVALASGGLPPATVLAGFAAQTAEERQSTGEPQAVDPVAEAYRVFASGRQAEMSGDREAAASAYRRASELDADAAGPLLALAQIHLGLGDLEAAGEAASEAVRRDPTEAAGHRIIGDIHFRRLRFGSDQSAAERAIAAFTEAVRLEPDDLESRSSLARLLASMRRTEQAETHFRELVARAPHAFHDLFLLAGLRLAAGDSEEAFGYVVESLAIEPRQPEAREMLDDLLGGETDPDRRRTMLEEAVGLYETAAAENPDDDGIGLAWADVLARSGRTEEAAVEFERVAERSPDEETALIGLAMVRQQQMRLEDAEEALGRLLDRNDRNVPARFSLGGVFLERCEYRKAAAAFENLLDRPREAYGLRQRRSALVRLGYARQELGEHDEAIDAFRTAVELASSGPEAFRLRELLAGAYLAADRPEDAGRLLHSLMEEHPDDLALRARRAGALAAAGRSDEARKILDGLAREHEGHPAVFQALLAHHMDEGDFEEARMLVESRLRDRPDDSGLRFQLGAVLESEGRYDEAEAEFRAVLDESPENALALNYLGYMLAERTDRLDESLDLIERALAEDPYNGSYLDSLGWVRFRRGELDLAEPNLLRAERCMPRNSVVLDHLGDLYRAKGDAERAVGFWRRALMHDEDEELERADVARKIEDAGNGRN